MKFLLRKQKISANKVIGHRERQHLGAIRSTIEFTQIIFSKGQIHIENANIMVQLVQSLNKHKDSS